jgi:hypothetical protein
MNNIIIHIAGPSGAGKTYMGNKLQNYFKDKIVVKDLEDLRQKFIEKYCPRNAKFNVTKYQKYIDYFISKNKKPIIFVGLNDNDGIEVSNREKKIYYTLYADYNYYIDIDDDTVAKQKCKRIIPIIKRLMTDNVDAMIYETKSLLLNIELLMDINCNINEIIKMNNKWKKDYIRQGYKCLTRENIYKNILQILKNIN